jgi:hypothetical protein
MKVPRRKLNVKEAQSRSKLNSESQNMKRVLSRTASLGLVTKSGQINNNIIVEGGSKLKRQGSY